MIDIDEMRRRLDLELHQVEQVGAARYEFGVWLACSRSGRGWRLGAFVGEGLHACLPATSVTASAMLE